MDNDDIPRHRPLAFDKMESLIKEMQDPETGVPVRSQKLFLTFIPSAFMGYDLVEWLMERYNLDESSNVEAINLANQLCQYGYFFPVNDSKNLVLKDDSSLYRFQSPYYWPWQAPRVSGGPSAATVGPDNVEYAIYLVKRTLRNKQRHGLEDYELEALANLKKNLAAKWDFITMQAEEQVRLAKERKKGDKIVSDSQERAYWRVARPPPGMSSALEPCPVPVRARAPRPRRRTIHHLTKEVELLKASLDRTRVKTSIALEACLAYSETFAPYDPWLTPPQPSNPWVSDDTLYWQINSPIVELPSEKRVQRWSISMEELVADPTGLQEFTSFLRKEYSHENIRFWLAVVDLRRSGTRHIQKKLDDIYEEFLKPGAACEINIDGATAERVAEGMRSGSRFALDHAADHVYNLLLKKDCYPRFVRSDHFQRLLTEGKNVHQKKPKFFNFGGQVKKKPGTSGSGSGGVIGGSGGGSSSGGSGGGGGTLSRRRGSDRSLSGSAHELALCAAQPPRPPEPPPHSHSQSNLADIPFRDPNEDDSADVLPWESAGRAGGGGGGRRRQDSAADSGSSSSDVSGAVVGGVVGAERARRLPQQSTLDGGLRGAPPPLRRLSAVEPRHLAPLASPPHSPRAAAAAASRPTPTPARVNRPTPTISVSSAPDDESPPSPPSPRSLPRAADEPPPVFASAADKTLPFSDSVCDNCRTDADASGVEVTVQSESETSTRPAAAREARDGDRTSSSRDGAVSLSGASSREPSTIKETSPASDIKNSSEIDDLPESLRGGKDDSASPAIVTGAQVATEDVVAVASPRPAPAALTVSAAADTTSTSATLMSAAADSTSTSTTLVSAAADSASTSATPVSAATDSASTSTISVSVAADSVSSSATPMSAAADPASTSATPVSAAAVSVAITAVSVSNAPVPVPVKGAAMAAMAAVAPLAVGEDVGVDDDNIDKVPSAPLQRVSGVSKTASESDAKRKIAHKDELSSVSESNIVKRDNKSDTSERRQRNDICPWEDENSCESDAPFVKTYATLGYL